MTYFQDGERGGISVDTRRRVREGTPYSRGGRPPSAPSRYCCGSCEKIRIEANCSDYGRPRPAIRTIQSLPKMSKAKCITYFYMKK